MKVITIIVTIMTTLLEVACTVHPKESQAFEDAVVHKDRIDENLVDLITQRMDALDAGNHELKQRIAVIKQENSDLIQVQELLLKRTSLVRQLQDEVQAIQYRVLQEELLSDKDFKKFKVSVETAMGTFATVIKNSTDTWNVMVNKTQDLETEANEASDHAENAGEEIHVVCDFLTSFNCTPEIRFLSEGQAYCDVETMHYGKNNATLCQGTFPTVIVMAGLQFCSLDIEEVVFTLTRPDGSTLTVEDYTWPYSISDDIGGILHGEVFPNGSYTLSYVIQSSRAACTLKSSNVSFQVTETNCTPGVDHPLRYPGNGHLYSYDPTPTPWSDASNAAQMLTCCGVHGHLPVIRDDQENIFVRSLADPLLFLLSIGLTDAAQEGNFTWITNSSATNTTEALNYTNWFPGEPSNAPGENCVQMGDDGTWKDFPCDIVQPNFVAAYEWDCL